MEQTPEALRAEAARLDDAKEESFERSDTDGFLSQWALGLSADKKRREAALLEAGGVAEFPGLFTLDGVRVRAKLISGKYGMAWAFCDLEDKFTGKFVSALPRRPETMRKKGYEEKPETVKAKVVMEGRGHGLSGSAWVATKRLDKGYPEDAEVE